MQLLPQEIEVWYIIPALRRDMCKIMVAAGIKQKDIAEKLSIAKSSVSQYLKGKRAKNVDFDKTITQEIQKSVKNIVENNSCPIREIQLLLNLIKKEKFICEIHKKFDNVNANCGVCVQ